MKPTPRCRPPRRGGGVAPLTTYLVLAATILCSASVSAQEPELLTCGVPVSGTLTPGETDTYRVTTPPGVEVVIQSSAVSAAFGPVHLNLTGPGVSIDTCTGAVQFTGISDDLTLQVSPCSAGAGGNYAVTLNIVSEGTDNCGRVLECDATPDGTGFAVAGEVDSYQLPLVAGEATTLTANYLEARSGEPDVPLVQVFDPTGNEVTHSFGGTIQFNPAATGAYTALVSYFGAPMQRAYRIEFYRDGCPVGPTITSFLIADAAENPLSPIGFNADSLPIFNQQFGQGFTVVLEARAGKDGQRPGDSTVPYNDQAPDLQMIFSRPLGDGDPTVCDITPPNQGGVAATVPLDFTATPDTIAHIDDMGCRFDNGRGLPLGNRDTTEACTRSDQGFGFSFVDRRSVIQYCAPIASAWAFPVGDTTVAAQVKDTSGNFGTPREIVVRIGDPNTPTPPSTQPPPTSTPSSTRTATRTRTSTRTPIATATGPTPTITPTPDKPICAGDCNGNGVVSVDEITLMLDIALGAAGLDQCPAGAPDGDGRIDINDLLRAVNNLLGSCPAAGAR